MYPCKICQICISVLHFNINCHHWTLLDINSCFVLRFHIRAPVYQCQCTSKLTECWRGCGLPLHMWHCTTVLVISTKKILARFQIVIAKQLFSILHLVAEKFIFCVLCGSSPFKSHIQWKTSLVLLIDYKQRPLSIQFKPISGCKRKKAKRAPPTRAGRRR